MDFDLTSEQRMLADSLDRFGRERYDPAIWRRLTAQGATFDKTNWAWMAEQGWLALTLPEEAGGLGGGSVDVMVMMEAMGRFLMLEPFVSACVIAPLLLGEGQTELCERIGLGEAIVALAVGEPAGRYDLAWIETRAERRGDGYVLTGAKCHVPDGGGADHFIVPARLSGEVDDRDGIGLFLVSADAPGLTVSRHRAPDHGRHASLKLGGVAAKAVLAGPEDGLDRLELAVDHAIVARLAEALGAMEVLSEMTLLHLRTRKQFGAAIGSFQVLQHRMVDIAIACEEARSLVYGATLSLHRPRQERQRIVSAAKARVGQAALFAGRQAVQLHGGVGASDELMVGHYLKRLMMIDHAFGSADHHLARFATLSDALN